MSHAAYPHKELFDEVSDIRIRKKRIPAREKAPLHWHDYLEFECIISGTAEHCYNDKTCQISRGDVYLLQCYDFHALRAETDLVLYSLHFHERLLNPALVQALQATHICLRLEEAELQKLFVLLEALLDEVNETRPYHELLLQSQLNCVFAHLLRLTAPQSMQPPSLPMQRAVAYMQSHYTKPLKLHLLAKTLGYSPNYLGHLFQAQLGYRFQDYLHLLRLKHACSLLQNSSLTVTQIAASAGYQSVEYFTQVFKKKFGVPPLIWRQQAQFYLQKAEL